MAAFPNPQFGNEAGERRASDRSPGNAALLMPADRGQHRDDDHNKADRGNGCELKSIFCLHTHGSTCIAGATTCECVLPTFCFPRWGRKALAFPQARERKRPRKSRRNMASPIWASLASRRILGRRASRSGAFLRPFLFQDFSSRAAVAAVVISAHRRR